MRGCTQRKIKKWTRTKKKPGTRAEDEEENGIQKQVGKNLKEFEVNYGKRGQRNSRSIRSESKKKGGKAPAAQKLESALQTRTERRRGGRRRKKEEKTAGLFGKGKSKNLGPPMKKSSNRRGRGTEKMGEDNEPPPHTPPAAGGKTKNSSHTQFAWVKNEKL